MTDHPLTIFVNDEDRLSTKLRAAQTSRSPVAPFPSSDDSSGGPRDPRTRRKLNDLYQRAVASGYPPDRDAFLIMMGRALADLHPGRQPGPALTLANLTHIEHALFEHRPLRLPYQHPKGVRS